MRKPVKGNMYQGVALFVWEEHQQSVHDFLLERVNVHGWTVIRLAKYLRIHRQRVYEYARANGVHLGTRPHAVDMYAPPEPLRDADHVVTSPGDQGQSYAAAAGGE